MNTSTRITALALLAAATSTAFVGCDKNDSTSTKSTPTSTTTNKGTDYKPSSDTTTSKSTTPPNADNTSRNKDHDATKTPTDQGQNAADVKITADIRKAIMDDKAMSVNAQNCKIITETGRVTLRGPVDSVAEKDSIEAKAKAVAGVVSVDNQLEVKAK